MTGVILWGCGGAGAAPSVVPGPAGTYSSAHFVFQYTALDAGNITTIASAVEGHYDRILSDLGADRMPAVTVTLYLDHAAMVAATQAVAGPIGEFVVTRWGQRALRDLIVANGDTDAVLAISQSDFQRDWFAFVRERYRL